MKKLFGFVLLGIGILIPGAKSKQFINNHAVNNQTQQVKASDAVKDDTHNQNLTQEEQQNEIQERLKGLGYF